MLKIRFYFAQKSVKIFLSLLLIVGGVAYGFFDTFTYLPYIFILCGLVAISLPRLFKFLFFAKLNSRSFYIVLFLLYYMPFSFQHEVYKKYYLKIILPEKQINTYFVASNTSLKWYDLFLTWFYPTEIEVDFRKKTIVNLHRGLPNHLNLNDKEIYEKGYSSSIINGKEGKYHYVVLMPLNNNIPKSEKEKNFDKYNIDGFYGSLNINDAELNREERQRKVDSLEKSHALQ